MFKIELRESIGLDEDFVEGVRLGILSCNKNAKNSTTFSLSV
ncbi:conserved hypothetical protein [Staphylococcus argenteus]|uniref:Uncharacterized protein n=1 Tax=Staphylococcus argenteus TaxID=985002 RepID=A0A7U7JUB5_9STAP|nr:conserved hypothetical protein [Staphylococcus argenteus]CRI27102.1 conserved hypothetical protein [Staphylococcus argenteus]